ncbi:hypothetical protein D3C84_720390 [compost metagenome]
MLADVKSRRANRIQAQFIRQVGRFGCHLVDIGQGPQALHHRLLRRGQADLLSLVALFNVGRQVVIAVVRVARCLGGRLEPVNRLAEAADLEAKAAFGQFGQRLGAVIQQTHREIRAAGQRRAQRKAKAQAQ